MKATSFDRYAGLAAILAAIIGLFYSVSFVVWQNVLLSSLFLMLGLRPLQQRRQTYE